MCDLTFDETGSAGTTGHDGGRVALTLVRARHRAHVTGALDVGASHEAVVRGGG